MLPEDQVLVFLWPHAKPLMGLPCVGAWWGMIPTVEGGHAEVLAWALGAPAEQQRVLIIVGFHHGDGVGAAPVWEPKRRLRLEYMSPTALSSSTWKG